MKPNSALTVATLSARPALPAADKVTHLAPPSSHRALPSSELTSVRDEVTSLPGHSRAPAGQPSTNLGFPLGVVLLLALTALSARGAQLQMLHGHVPPALKSLAPAGRLPASSQLHLAIGLPLRNPAGLSNLLQQIYDPASPNYHHYLTPAEFTEKFGPTDQDYQAVIAFAGANHLQVTTTHLNRLLLDVSGSAAEVEQALHVTLHTYQHPTENRTFYAPNQEPSLDLSVPVLHISGLDNYALPRPHLHATRLMSGQHASPNTFPPSRVGDRRSGRLMSGQNVSPNAGSGPSGTYMGLDFRAAYVPDTALSGSGQVVGLLQFDGYTPSDITYYETKAGLPNVPLQNVLLDGFSGSPTRDGGEVEVSLDIEMSISMATNLSKVIVYEAGPAGSWHDLLNRMANDNVAKQLSCSWYIPGGGADAVADGIFQQMAAQGQSFFNASGDDDAYTGLISFAGDSPYITQVGGTTLTTTGPKGAWVSEKAWNWGDGIGSGGGISTQYPIPSWQTNISMAANQGSATMRNTPDVAFIADQVYVRADGEDYNVGGTSCAAPLWAGFAALVNQQAANTGQPPIGFLNPAVEAIGSGANYPTTFHDITTGNNTNGSSPKKFYAVAGYDLCTGWGTPAGQQLINALANPEPLLVTPATGFSAIGGVGGPFTVAAQSFTLTNAGTNTLTWTLSNTSAWLNVSSGGGTLPPGAPSATVTVSLNQAASNLLIGTYSGTIWITNQNDQLGQSRQFTLSVISPPSITQQPVNQAVLEGATAAFSVQASGGLPLVYQWQLNGTNLADGGAISGSATTHLTINDVSAANMGDYTVVVTNFAGTVASSNALLTIVSSPPVIVTQPVSQTAFVGQNVQLMVAAIGTTPYSYQWSLDATNIAGATNATLMLTNVQLNQSGNFYSVQVTNVYGATNSAPATLTVLPCDPPPGGLVSWWRGEGNADDSNGANNGALQGGVTFTTGEVGQAFSLDGSSGYISVPASASLNVGLSSGFTIEGWINPRDMALQRTIAEWNNNGTWGAHFMLSAGSGGGVSVGSLYADILDTGGGNHLIWSASGTIVANQFQHVAVTYDKTSGMATLYANGVVVAQQSLGVFTPQTSYNFYLGYIVSHSGTFSGLLDEFSVYSRALATNEIQAIYAVGGGGKCIEPMPPTITAQPASQTNYAGTTASFTVMVTGTPPLSYQWSLDGTNIVGANSATLALVNVQFTNAGNYSVLVSNPYGATNSTTAVLTVVAAPLCDPPPDGLMSWWRAEGNANDSIGTNNGVLQGGVSFAAGEVGQAFSLDGSSGYIFVPASASLNVGLSSGFTIEGWINPRDMAFQRTIAEWNNNGTWGAHFMLSAGSGGGVSVGSLYADILDTGGKDHLIWSASGTIVTNQFQHVAVTYDQTSGVGTLYANGVVVAQQSLGVFTPQTSYNFYLGYIVSQSGMFSGLLDEFSVYSRALATNEIQAIYAVGGGGKCFAPVPPTITTQPTNQTVNAASAATFAVVAGGTPPLSYQWSFNTTNLAGATNATLMLTNVQPGNAGVYSVAVSNLYGSIVSSNVVLTVLTYPPAITTQPTNQSVNAASAATFAVVAGGTPPLSYQWSFNTTNLVGATNATLTLANVQPVNAGNYSVAVSNLYGSIVSSNGVLTVLTYPPAITTQPASQTNFPGTMATFSVSAQGTPPLNYQWSFNGTNIPGATSATLALANVQYTNAGNYSVLVSNSYGATNSTAAALIVVPPSACDPPPGGLVSWWRAEGNANDSIGMNNGVLQGGVSYVAGEVGQAFSLDGSSGYVVVSASASLNVGLSSGFTIEGWIKPRDMALQRTIAEWNNNGTWGAHFMLSAGNDGGVSIGSLYADILDTGGRDHLIWSASGTIVTNQFQHVAVTYDKSSGVGTLYANGVMVAQQSLGIFTPQTSYNFYLGYIVSQSGMFSGLLDEFSVYSRALATNEIQAIYNAGSNGKCFVPVPPTIMTQPSNQTVNAASAATFAVVAGGTPPLSYQWIFNATNLLGATNAMLTLANVQPGNAGVYSVTVSNLYGSIDSSNVVLTVLTHPPTITTQPASQTNFAGTMATFSVTAGGTPPLKYQWSFNGTNILGATNTTLALANVQFTNAGNYSVQVTNLYGMTNSTAAMLTVVPPACDPPPGGLVSWWRAEGNAYDSIGTNNGSFMGAFGYTNGEVGQAFSLDGSSGYVVAPASASLNVGLSNGLTIEGWINPRDMAFQRTIAEWNNNGTWGAHFMLSAGSGGGVSVGSLYADILDTGGKDHLIWSASGTIVTNQFQHVAVTYDKTSGVGTLYANGVVVAQQSLGVFTPQTSYSFYLGYIVSHSGMFSGLLDEFSLYSRALATNEIQAIYHAGGNGKCPPAAPFIATQPANQAVAIGNPGVFMVVAGGSLPLTYQWRFNGTNLVAATNSTLVLLNVQATNAGVYSVAVSNLYGAIISSNAVLTVGLPPAITTQPTNQTVTLGSSAAFSVSASGSPVLSCQWSFDGTNIAGATNSVLTLTNAQLTNAGNYSVSVTNLFGFVTSSNALLTVLAPPAITQPPASSTNVAGSTASFVATASGTLPLSYQWQKNGLPLNNGGNVSGATATGLTLAGVQDADAASYALVVTNVAGSVTSSPAILVVLDPPTVTLQPTNQWVLVGSNAVLATAASGTAPLGCQWSCNGTNLCDTPRISGSQCGVLVISNAVVRDTGNYQVLFTNRLGSATSSVAVLSVGRPPQILSGPASHSAPPGCTVSFTVVASGSRPLACQWWKDGNLLDAQTNATLTVSNFQSADLGGYSVALTNWFGSVTSAPAVLSVGYHPPVAGADVVYRFAAGGVRISVTDLLANDVDTNGDSLTIIGVNPNSTAGGLVFLANNWIYYAPPSGWTNSDSFTYTVSDGLCETAEGTVWVQVTSDNPQPAHFAIGTQGTGPVQLSFTGIPGSQYQLQYADSLVNPNWQVLATQAADSYGVCQFTDSSPTNTTARYYRAIPVLVLQR